MILFAETNKNDAAPEDTDEPDLILTKKVAARDAAAQREMVARLLPRINRICAYLCDSNEAPDLAQTAIIQAVCSAGSFRGECSLEYWADRVTVRTAAKYFQKRNRRQRLLESVWMPDKEVSDVEKDAARRAARRQIQYQFSKISKKQRTAVVLHHLYGYNVPEIADLLDVKINAVRSRLRKGLKTLRRNILADPLLREWVKGDRT